MIPEYDDIGDVFDHFYEMLSPGPIILVRPDGQERECANFGEARDFWTYRTEGTDEIRDEG